MAARMESVMTVIMTQPVYVMACSARTPSLAKADGALLPLDQSRKKDDASRGLEAVRFRLYRCEKRQRRAKFLTLDRYREKDEELVSAALCEPCLTCDLTHGSTRSVWRWSGMPGSGCHPEAYPGQKGPRRDARRLGYFVQDSLA